MDLLDEMFLADAQQVSVQQPGGLQQASSPTAPQGLAGAGRRLRASGPQMVSIYVAPQPGQVGCTGSWKEVQISLGVYCILPFEGFRVLEKGSNVLTDLDILQQ